MENSEFFFYAGLLVLTIKGLLSSCPCSDQPNGLSLSLLLECEVTLNAFSPGSESYLDGTISVTMFHIKSLCQAPTTRQINCLLLINVHSSLLSHFVSVQKEKLGKLFSYPAFPVAKSGIMSVGKQLLQSQSRTAFLAL